MHTYIKPKRDDSTAYFVETWYNRQARLWVTQLKNANREQQGEAIYSAKKDSAALAHSQTVNWIAGEAPFINQAL